MRSWTVGVAVSLRNLDYCAVLPPFPIPLKSFGKVVNIGSVSRCRRHTVCRRHINKCQVMIPWILIRSIDAQEVILGSCKYL